MNEMCPLDPHEDEMGKNIKMKPSIQWCVGGIFYGAYWTRKRSEGKKMNNDEYMVLFAGEIDKVLGLW